MPWRRWVFIGGGIVVAVIVLGLLGGAINLITDVMWYDALDRRDVLQTRLWAQIALFAIGFAAMLVPVLVSVWLARRIVPQAPVRRLGGWELPDVSRLIGLALVGIAVLLALGSGAAWSGAWETILLFFNGEAWGTTDPDPRSRHRLLRLRPAVLALRARLGLDGADHRRHPDAGGLCAPGRFAGSSTSLRPSGRISP